LEWLTQTEPGIEIYSLPQSILLELAGIIEDDREFTLAEVKLIW
jgi:hypothetical protein